jgi:hypothetical protein
MEKKMKLTISSVLILATFLLCRFFPDFFAHENIKNPSSKEAYFSLCWAVSILSKNSPIV